MTGNTGRSMELNARYYYPVKVGFFKNAIGAVASKLIKRMMKRVFGAKFDS